MSESPGPWVIGLIASLGLPLGCGERPAAPSELIVYTTSDRRTRTSTWLRVRALLPGA